MNIDEATNRRVLRAAAAGDRVQEVYDIASTVLDADGSVEGYWVNVGRILNGRVETVEDWVPAFDVAV